MKFSNKINLTTIFLITLTFFISSCNESNNLPKVGIIQMAENPMLDLATKGAIKALEDAGLQDGQNISIDYKSAQGELSNIPLILKSFNNSNYEIIIANTTPCMAGAVTIIKDKPVVMTVSFSPEQVGLTAPDNLYGYYDPLNVKSLIHIMKQCIPGLKTLGLPYNPSEPNAELAKDSILKACKEEGIELVLQATNSVNDILPTLQSLLNNKVEALIIAADNTMSLGLNLVSDFAQKHKLPIFVTESFHVENGAALGKGLDSYEWGYKSGEMAAELLKNGEVEGPKIRPLESYKLQINKTSSKNQGLFIPDDIMKSADKVIN